MKLVIGTLGLIAAALLNADPAAACTTDPNVTDFSLRWVAESNTVILGNVTLPDGASRVAVCATRVYQGNSTTTVEWPIVGNNWYIQTSLPSKARVCLGAGNDSLRVVRPTDGPVQCGGVTFNPLNYGSGWLIAVGQDGNDTFIGGDGVDVADFNSGVTASGATDQTSTGKGPDTIRANRFGTTNAWGGSGTDKYFSYNGGVFNVRDFSGNDSYYGSLGATDHFCDVGGVLGSSTIQCGPDATDFQNVQNPGTTCPFDLLNLCAAQALVPLPFPAIDQ